MIFAVKYELYIVQKNQAIKYKHCQEAKRQQMFELIAGKCVHFSELILNIYRIHSVLKQIPIREIIVAHHHPMSLAFPSQDLQPNEISVFQKG